VLRLKAVRQIHSATRDDIGDLTTRRPLPSPTLNRLGAFAFLNHHGPRTYAPVSNNLDGNLGRTPAYFHNSRSEWIDQPQLNEPPLAIEDEAAHWDHHVDDDRYQQPDDSYHADY